jgi:hypothetical protein
MLEQGVKQHDTGVLLCLDSMECAQQLHSHHRSRSLLLQHGRHQSTLQPASESIPGPYLVNLDVGDCGCLQLLDGCACLANQLAHQVLGDSNDL